MSVYEEIGWIKQLGEFVQELHKKRENLSASASDIN